MGRKGEPQEQSAAASTGHGSDGPAQSKEESSADDVRQWGARKGLGPRHSSVGEISLKVGLAAVVHAGMQARAAVGGPKTPWCRCAGGLSVVEWAVRAARRSDPDPYFLAKATQNKHGCASPPPSCTHTCLACHGQGYPLHAAAPAKDSSRADAAGLASDADGSGTDGVAPGSSSGSGADWPPSSGSGRGADLQAPSMHGPAVSATDALKAKAAAYLMRFQVRAGPQRLEGAACAAPLLLWVGRPSHCHCSSA